MNNGNSNHARAAATSAARADAPAEVVTHDEHRAAGWPRTGTIISRSVYRYNAEDERVYARHYGPRTGRGRWRAALLLVRLLASCARRCAGTAIRSVAATLGL